jgi:hypothetical protein
MQRAMAPLLLELEKQEASLMWREAQLVPEMCASARGRGVLSDAMKTSTPERGWGGSPRWQHRLGRDVQGNI